MSVDKNFEDLILKLNKENDKEIFSFFYENKKYWLKKARATSSNIFHKICYKLFSYDILVPVENKSPKESLYFESAKLKLFLENGIDVPKVVFRNNECFVMSDSGNTVYEYIKKDDIVKDEFEYYLNNMITLLSKVHNYGFYHGGAQSS
ncbi:MAG: hypothetical protein GY932_14070 [Arcobacter sp.]|nr:hypothetical protein [Arcobacter sp.]